LSIGVECSAIELLTFLKNKNVAPHLLTDQTSAHDPVNGYVPKGMNVEQAVDLRRVDPKKKKARAIESMAGHPRRMLEHPKQGPFTFDYGHNIRAYAKEAGVTNAFDFPGFVPEYVRPLFCEGSGPFRWVALSGDPEDIAVTDEAMRKAFPENKG